MSDIDKCPYCKNTVMDSSTDPVRVYRVGGHYIEIYADTCESCGKNYLTKWDVDRQDGINIKPCDEKRIGKGKHSILFVSRGAVK